MKITFITYIYPYPDRGYNPGIERVVQEFARELVQQGHDVHVLTTYRNGGSKKTETDKGVCLHRIPDARQYFGKVGSIFSIDLLSINYSIKEYSSLLESSDIVHTFTPIVWKFFSTPLIAHYHHWDEPSELAEYLYLPTSHRFWMQCYDRADRIIAVSEFSAADLASRGVDRNKIETVPNGVDTDTYYPGSSSIEFKEWDQILLYVGPLMERKGLEYLIKAMPNVLSEHPNTGLIVVGSGEEKPLLKIANDQDVCDHIQFEGFVPEDKLPDYYRAADVFVFPSLLEGFGMVLVEAMASGLPVISTTASAIPEVVGDSGLLVPPRDEINLAATVCDLLDSGELDQWGTWAQTRVQNKFTWTQTTSDLYSVYTECIQ